MYKIKKRQKLYVTIVHTIDRKKKREKIKKNKKAKKKQKNKIKQILK